MSTVDQSDFNNTEILDDGAIEQIGQEVNELIELLDDEDDNDNSTVVRYPGLASNSTKRNHEKRDGIKLFIINIKLKWYLNKFIRV